MYYTWQGAQIGGAMSQRWLAEVVSSSDVAIYELRMHLAIVRSQEMSGFWQRVENGLLNIVGSSDRTGGDKPKWLDGAQDKPKWLDGAQIRITLS